MKVIDLKKNAPRTISVMTYGASRVGKTRFAATWPRPLFFADATEKGWETIRNMNPENFYDPNFIPEVWAIEEPQDMFQSIQSLGTRLKQTPGDIQTLVIDSLTLYSDLYYTGLEVAAVKRNNQVDRRRLYGDLGQHLAWLITEVHKLPVNVLWLCLEKAPQDGSMGGPLLTGQTRDKAPARCEYLLYQRAYRVKADEPPTFEIRTKPFGPYIAGGRQGDLQLPDPLEPTFTAFATAIGMPLPAPPSKGGRK
ncbi:MAG: AAA family ATPase [Gemmatimonadota bacterium]|nr:MAG: AAA family ATPase [Gemmatimonadota bacterium]